MLERIKEVSEAARLIPYGAGRYSQLGEDVILKYIADQIGVTSGVFVDIGASDGKSMSNSYLFRGLGWEVRAYDGAYESELVARLHINSVNVWRIIEDSPDIISIDIDGLDYYILGMAISLTPNPHPASIICLEFNGCIQQDRPATVPLDDNFKHDGTDYYGANLAAFKQLLSDYTLVFHHHSQNAFFVHKSFNAPEFTESVVRSQYHPHDMTEREWQYL